MLVCYITATKEIIETQSYAPAGLLIQNAVGYGYNASDLTEVSMTQSEYQTFLSQQTPSVLEQQASIISQLEQLDAFLPRGVEDMLTAYNMDVTKLPTVQQNRLTQKATLRSQLAALGS